MTKICEKCQKEFDEVFQYCEDCGTPLKEKEKEKLKPTGLILLMIIMAGIIIIPFLMKGITSINDKNVGNDYLKKYIIPTIKNKYNTDVKNSKFLGKSHCLKSVSNNFAGDSGSHNEKVRGCYVYSYEVEILGDTTRYYLVSNPQKYIYDEYEYTLVGKDLLQYKEYLGDFEIKYLYYNVEESDFDAESKNSIDWALKHKTMILNYNDNIKNVINKDFLEKYADIVNEMKTKHGFQGLNILLAFSDKYIVDYRNGDYEKLKCYHRGGIGDRRESFQIDTYTDIDKINNNTCIEGRTYIFRNDAELTDESIVWCIDNKKSSPDYEEYASEKK